MEYWGGVKLDSETGSLSIAGHGAVTLARSYGTPLVVMNEDDIRARIQEYGRALAATGYPSWQVAYAGKAFLTLAMSQLVASENVALDVVSGGELHVALAGGFPSADIFFHGNNKSRQELREAVGARVGRIVVDNFHEMERLGQVAREAGQRVAILLRIAPGVEAHTHEYIQTGTEDTKFGFDLASGQALQAVKYALADEHLDLRGFHCHIGSQIMDLEPFPAAVAKMMAFVGAVAAETGFTASELDMGGGVGIRYVPSDRPPSVESFVRTIVDALRREAARLSVPLPRLILEPGRSIVGEAGTTVYSVGSIKRLENLRTYVSVDGGMTDNPRPALYNADYTALGAPHDGAANRKNEECRVVGKCCESGDILVRSCSLPAPEEGDLVALLSTGAYTYSMASHYNRLLMPAVIFVNTNRARLIVKRQRYQDLLRGEQSLDAEPLVLNRRLAPEDRT